MSQDDDDTIDTGIPLSAFEEALKAVESIQKSERAAKPAPKKSKVEEIDVDVDSVESLDDLLRSLEGESAAPKTGRPAAQHAQAQARHKGNEDLEKIAELLREEQNLEKEAEFLRSVLLDKAAKEPGVDSKTLEEKQGQIQELHERLLRMQADFNNFKKRIERDKADMVRFSNESLLMSLLPIIDNLERALAHARATMDREAVIDGVELILRQLFDTLAAKGLRRMESESEWFDPAFHEAMATMEAEDVEPGRIVSQYERGYLLHGRLLRPAKVIVATKPAGNHRPAASEESSATATEAGEGSGG